MGLDCYLSAKKYITKWEYGEGHKDRWVTQEFQDALPMDAPDITTYGGHAGLTICYPVGYWRKANAIHNFFVQGIGGGEDNCQEMWVSRDVLIDLRARCVDVLNADDMEAKAKEIGLETTSGFFFGDTEYGDWYKDDLRLTIDICNHVLALPEEYSLYYQASW
jgi:hypothetical protein